MISTSPLWLANPGTAQQQRLPPAMADGYFRVDERGLPDFIAASAALAESLRYFNLQREPEGTWGNWIRNDEAFILQLFAGIDVERLAAEFLGDNGGTTEQRILRFRDLARRIYAWYEPLQALVDRPAGVAVCTEILRLVAEHPDYGRFAVAMAQADDKGAIDLFRKSLAGFRRGDSAREAVDEDSEVRKVFFSFLNAVTRVKERAVEQLAVSLSSNTHEPSAGLFLAFLQLYGVVQKRINEFTQRHTDFYYRDCLRMAPRPVASDSVHLVCGRVPTPELEVTIRQGTAFALRNAAGREIVYRADEDVEVTPVQVSALHTLRLERDLLISPERELNYVTRAKAQRLPVDVDESPARPYWPLFGGSAGGSVAGSLHDAALGIAIASPILLLGEGAREIRTRLSFAHPADLDGWVTAEIRKLAGPPDAAMDSNGLLESVVKVFLRFAQLDQRAEEAPAAEDEMELFDAAHNRVRPTTHRPPATIAANVLVRRLRALTMAGAWQIGAALKLAQHQVTVRSAWALSAELQRDVGRDVAQVLGTGIDIRFEVQKELAEGIQFLVDGRDWLPGAAHEMAKQAFSRLQGRFDRRTLYSAFLLQRTLRSADEQTIYNLLGRLFCRWMLLDSHALSADDVLAIRKVLALTRLTRWLVTLTEADKRELRPELRRAQHRITVHSIFEFSSDQQTQLAMHARNVLGAPIVLQFEKAPQFIDGLRVMVNQRDWLAQPQFSNDAAGTALPNRADILSLIRGYQFPERDFLAGKLLSELFDVGLTAADRWLAPADTFVVGGDPARPVVDRDVTVVVRLPPEAPPIVAHNASVHGNGWQTSLPAMRLRLKPDTAMFCYSLLADLVLTDIHVDVAVRGAQDAVVYNHLGRLDPSKPFSPFGPLPAYGSYMVFGNSEIAQKNITSLSVNIDWGNLPHDKAGFASHYEGYGPGFSNQGFKAVASILCGGQWEPRENTVAQPLFAGPEDGRVDARCTLKIDGPALRNYFRPVRATGAEADFGYDASTRNGFFRIALTEPAQAFGHVQYPQLLTEVLSHNARRRRPRPVPNAPYTPLIERLTFDYRASASMHFANDEPDERAASGDRVLLIHPFGYEEVYPAIGSASKGPIPRFSQDGNLYIGLSAPETPGRITLLFSLRDESAQGNAGDAAEPRTAWSYLASNRWRPLEAARILANTTHGFLTSGIVTLDIPQDIDSSNTVLPSGYYWLCVGAETGFERFAGLHGVQAQAFRATRVDVQAGDKAEAAPSSGTVAQPLVSIPGLVSVTQRGDSFGGRAAESTAQFKTRAGERLRHKNRAAALWDYERLVLEHFPQVHMVKCFPSMSGQASAQGRGVPVPRPGSVTLAVVPVLPAGEHQATRAPKLNAIELERIRDYLKARASPFAEIVVRNAVYERILVRCAVSLKRGVSSGRSLQQLNRDIAQRISPWRPGGVGGQFNWILRKEEVEAWIRKFDYVDSVTRLSLLQISEDDDGFFKLSDSARRNAGASPGSTSGGRDGAPVHGAEAALRPLFPWSIAISAQRHAIEVMQSPMAAQATGISGLEIGNTFIVAGERDG